MKKLALFSTIDIEMNTQWGIIKVDFVVVDILPNSKYVLISQHRMCVGQLRPDRQISLSNFTDLLDIEPLKGMGLNKTEFTI